jgi:hypothetical protein
MALLRNKNKRSHFSIRRGDMTMKKWKIAIPVLAIALSAAWYAFRPERLAVNVRVNEGCPADLGSIKGNIGDRTTL